jgi:ectoine hydroxylase-related dioxygenase (phytanoyl-CoA dioxygenase family)
VAIHQGLRLGPQQADDHVLHFRREGYAILRRVFSLAEVEKMRASADAVHAEAVRHGRSFRHGNLFYRVERDEAGRPLVPIVQWPCWRHPALDAVRLDPRIARILAPLIGGDIKQIINQLHWKRPGGGGDFAWHQDSRFREPRSAYRNLGASYVQTGLALDPHAPESGCMRFVPRSHARGDLGLDESSQVWGEAMRDQALAAAGLSAADAIDVRLEPGDLALWNPYLVHGSGSNRADHQRRLYINGYVRAEDCDRGEWSFRGGRPVPLGPEPALVHYEQLAERPGPHYP